MNSCVWKLLYPIQQIHLGGDARYVGALLPSVFVKLPTNQTLPGSLIVSNDPIRAELFHNIDNILPIQCWRKDQYFTTCCLEVVYCIYRRILYLFISFFTY